MIFVDTGAWFATLVPDDIFHSAAAEFVRTNEEPLVTTDYILDELLTLLRARGHSSRGDVFVRQVLEGRITRLEWVTDDDFVQAALVYRRNTSWSFTDCVSNTVTRRLGIKKAFAFDEHFKQFGTVNVVP
jgi:predicted nucleic acid-binding protein